MAQHQQTVASVRLGAKGNGSESTLPKCASESRRVRVPDDDDDDALVWYINFRVIIDDDARAHSTNIFCCYL